MNGKGVGSIDLTGLAMRDEADRGHKCGNLPDIPTHATCFRRSDVCTVPYVDELRTRFGR